MLVADRHELARASGDRLSDDRFRVVDEQQYSAGRAVECRRAETPQGRRRRGNPKRRVADSKLGNDLLALADPVEHNRAECGLVERDRVGSAFNPQLWLDRDLS